MDTLRVNTRVEKKSPVLPFDFLTRGSQSGSREFLKRNVHFSCFRVQLSSTKSRWTAISSRTFTSFRIHLTSLMSQLIICRNILPEQIEFCKLKMTQIIEKTIMASKAFPDLFLVSRSKLWIAPRLETFFFAENKRETLQLPSRVKREDAKVFSTSRGKTSKEVDWRFDATTFLLAVASGVSSGCEGSDACRPITNVMHEWSPHLSLPLSPSSFWPATTPRES